MEVPNHLLWKLAKEIEDWAMTVRGSQEDQLATERVVRAAEAFPKPPKPDVVEECANAFHESLGFGIASVQPSEWKPGMRAALLLYRERGCPGID